MFPRLIVVLSILVLVINQGLASAAVPLEKRIRSGDISAIRAGYEQYSKTRNASKRERLKELLQTTLDSKPEIVLGLKGANVEDLCDGTDIDIAVGANTNDAQERTNRRILRIESSALARSITGRCVRELNRYLACVSSKNC